MIIRIVILLLFIFSLESLAQNKYKHQIGVDPGLIIKLFNTNENIEGINYKYNFFRNYFLRLGGYGKVSNKNSRTITNEVRIGIDKLVETPKNAFIFYGTDFVRNKIKYNNREDYILEQGLDLIFGLKLNTFKNLALNLDYRLPFMWTSFSDESSSNSDEFNATIGKSINFMIVFQF